MDWPEGVFRVTYPLILNDAARMRKAEEQLSNAPQEIYGAEANVIARNLRNPPKSQRLTVDVDAGVKTLTTIEAAAVLKRKPQTLRAWASVVENPPIHPIRVFGRLHWRLADVEALLNGEL